MKSSLISFIEIIKYIFYKQIHQNTFLYFSKMRERNNTHNQIKLITMILSINSNDSQAYYFRGMALYDIEEYKAAIDDFSISLEIDDQMYQVINCRGMCYYLLNDFDNALKDFLKSNKADVCNIFIYRADIYRRSGDIVSAIEDLKLAREIEPNNPNIIYTLGSLYFKKQAFNETIELMSFLIMNDLENDKAYDLRGCAYNQSKQYELARRDFEWCINNTTIDGRNFYNRGLTYFNTSQFNEALDDFNTSIKLGYNNNPNLYLYIGRTEIFFKNFQRALKWLNSAQSMDENNAKIYFFRSQLYKENGDLSNYEIDLKKARILNNNIDNEAFE